MSKQAREEVEQILNSQSITDADKIEQLKEIEISHYKPLIRQLAYKKSEEELKELLTILKDLGKLTTNLGELSGDIKYYTDASIFYQYVITMLDEKDGELGKILGAEEKNKFSKQELSDSYQQLTNIQQLIFLAIGGNQEKMPVIQEEAKTNKYLLSELRNKTDEELQVIESYRQKANTDNWEKKQVYQELYVNTVRALFEGIADEMKGFLAKLYSDSEREMAIAPPCKYAVIGLGSMALQQMTPYSDLEFAILIENEGKEESEGDKVKQYFKNLTHLVNFKVINLGESIIPTSKYGLDMSHLVHRAVNLDIGGKTPLGRIDGEKPYELIKTIEWMMHYVRNKEKKASHIDKNLPYILENVCYVHGDKEIVENYQNKVTEFLQSENVDDKHSRKNCEIRAIKILEKGAVEIDYLKPILDLKNKKTKFKGDLEKLQPDLCSTKGRLFDVKQEIYRLPDRLLYNLGLYYGIEGDSAWDTVDKLKKQSIINTDAARNLHNAITFATTLRLKTYSHHKAQNEDMSIFARPAETEAELKKQATQTFRLSEKDLGEQGGLFQYFYTALPFHEKLQEFCKKYQTLNNTDKEIFFQSTSFYEDDFVNKGFIYYRLAQYTKAQSNYLFKKNKYFYLYFM